MKKTFPTLVLVLLLCGMRFYTLKIQPVKASGTICIRADGSIDPPTAPISTTDNITYMFTDNIYDSSGISAQKSDIVVNGNGYVLNSKYEYGRGNYGFGLSNVNNITIENTSIRDFGYGIIIDQSDDNVILGNNITGSLMDGVWIASSWNNSLCGNRVERNSFGISIFSPYNLVYGNWISNNWVGIRVDASNINLTKNLFNSNNYQLSIEQESSDWRNYIDFIDSSNLIDGKPVYYLMNEKDLLITPVTYPDIGYLGLVNCTNITIENLTLRSNGQGLLFANTNNSRVIHNNIESNYDNVVLSSSFDNTFSENNLTDNRFFGALLLFSSNNRFYHNNFIFGPLSLGLHNSGSTVNTWDAGYPSGGNYWSDYSGTDVYSGPYQNETGSDGIGDTPYAIDANNKDHYPFMNPWRSHDVAVTSVVAVVPHCLSNVGNGLWVFQGLPVCVNVTVLNKGDFDENVNVTLYYNITTDEMIGTQNITIPTGENRTLSFVWDTTSVPYCHNYTITAAETIPLDNNPADNTLACGPINVRIMGDINGDGEVDVKDLLMAAKAFGSSPGDPRWNLDADINGDNKVDIRDILLVARNFGK
jgi:parallel beta-helix repeat protein